jgi:hypothetical protein
MSCQAHAILGCRVAKSTFEALLGAALLSQFVRPWHPPSWLSLPQRVLLPINVTATPVCL